MTKLSIFWYRRDLRIHDNAGLYHALKGPNPVLPLFIFDQNILDELEDKADARVEFIHDVITVLRAELQEAGGNLLVYYGKPEEVWKTVLKEYEVAEVYTNHDYEPYAIRRDEAIADMLEKEDVPFHTYKDHVIFERTEIEKQAGGPYTVFTPYSRTWKEKLDSRISTFEEDGDEKKISFYLKPYPTEAYLDQLFKTSDLPETPSLADMGFLPTDIDIPDRTVSRKLIKQYDKTRDYPAQDATSRLGIHFRFGTISIREKARRARQLNETFLNELIWRDFYAQILANYPHVAKESFRREYDFIEWRNNEEEFQAWCDGKTGFPIVDAGMRQLNQTGYMHNRVRMITASFLTKDLLIDWRWGEAYFASKLLDYDLASNNGGWQWAAGSGTDAAPYFRIFNPESQQKKYDKDERYIKEWIPEYGTDDYREPIVNHKEARERCLEVYKKGLEEGKAAVN